MPKLSRQKWLISADFGEYAAAWELTVIRVRARKATHRGKIDAMAPRKLAEAYSTTRR